MQIPKKISERELVKNWYVKILEEIYLTKDWKEHNIFVSSADKEKSIWVFILPITENWEIIYLKEFRYWPEKVIINFPGWVLEDWVDEIENCKNELIEETWYYSDDIKYLSTTILEPYIKWEMKYYIAKNCKKLKKQELDYWEYIEFHKTSIENFEKMIISWEVECSRTAYCFLLAKAKKLI